LQQKLDFYEIQIISIAILSMIYASQLSMESKIH